MKKTCFLLFVLMVIALASCQAAMESETDEAAGAQSQNTSCVALGQQHGYPYDMLQCHKRGAVTNADGCDPSWTGDKAWVCEVYKTKQPPNDEWDLLNWEGPTKTSAGATECDLCLGYTQGGNAELKGFWQFTQPARVVEVNGRSSISIRECSILQAVRTPTGLNPTTLYCESVAYPAVVVQGNPKVLRDSQTQQNYNVGQNVLSLNGHIVANKRNFNPSSVLNNQRGHALYFGRLNYPLEIGVEVGQNWQPLARYTAGGLGNLTQCFSSNRADCPPNLFRSPEYNAFYGENTRQGGAFPFKFTVNGNALSVPGFETLVHRRGPEGEFMHCEPQLGSQSWRLCAKVILP